MKPKWSGSRSGGGWMWSEREDVFLRQHAGQKAATWIAEQLGRSEDSVRLRANVVLKVSLLLSADDVCECGNAFTRTGHTDVCESCAHSRYKEYKKGHTKYWSKQHSELKSVRGHHNYIFNPSSRSHRNYKGMPFFDGWNPDKGGSHHVGAQWIIDHLGRRPEGASLHVIDHAIGFMPGNLEWTSAKKQNNQQMFKIIAQQRHQIKQLKRRLIEAQQVLLAA